MSIVRLSIAALVLAGCTTGTHTIGTIYATSQTIGPEGGTITVSAADDASIAGTSIVVPPGALSEPVKISIYEIRPVTAEAAPTIVIEPQTTHFARPASASIPAQRLVNANVYHPTVTAHYADGGGATLTGQSVGGFVAVQVERLGSFASLPPNAGAVTVDAVAVSPKDELVPLGLTLQFTATGTFSDGSTGDITSEVIWASSDAAVATIDTSGMFFAGSPGSTTILATFGTRTGSTTATVVGPGLTQLLITPSPITCLEGTTQQLTVTAQYSDGSMGDVSFMASWHIDDATIATVDSTGLLTCLAEGTTTVSANIGSIVEFSPVTVRPGPTLSLEINPLSPPSVCQDTQMFAVATFPDQSTQDVTGVVAWMSNDTGIATVDSAGVVRCLSAGDVTITASTNGVSDSAVLTCAGPTITGMALTPDRPRVPAGASLQLTLIATYCTGATADLTNDPSVSWSSNRANVASVSSPGGLVTSHLQGSVVITATVSDLSASVSTDTVTVTVDPHAVVSIALTRADGSQSQTTPLGVPVQYIAIATYTDGAMIDLTTPAAPGWTSSDATVANVQLGLATPVGLGTTVIKVQHGAVSATTTLTVGDAVLTRIDVTPANSTLPLGTTKQLTATGVYSDGSTRNLTGVAAWSSSNVGVATVLTGGLVQTVTRSSQPVVVTASMNQISGSAQVTVVSSVPALLTVRTNGGQEPVCAKGTTLVLTAEVTLTDGTVAVTNAAWTSSNSAVATVSPAGIVNCRSQGIVRLSASVNAVVGGIDLTVGPSVPVALVLGPPGASVASGATLQLSATLIFSDTTTVDVTSAVTWSSSNPSVTIFSSGVLRSVSVGTTQIHASYNGIEAAPLTITVGPHVLVSIDLQPVAPTLPLGFTHQLTASGTYSDGMTEDLTTAVTWSSSNPSVATVDAAGLVQSVSAGVTTITALLGTVEASTVVTLGPTTVVRIDLSAPTSTMLVGLRQRIVAMASYSDGSSADVASSLQWSSSDPVVATVDSQALVTAIAPGVTTLTAQADNLTTTVTVTVIPWGPSVTIDVAPGSTSVPLGETADLFASTTYMDGKTANITSTVVWSSSNPTVATVGSMGTVTTLSEGETTISASYGGVTGSSLVTVGPHELWTFASQATLFSLAVGQSETIVVTGTYTDGVMADVGSLMTWTSSDPSIATIDASGWLTGVSPGATTITIVYGVLSSTVDVVVAPAVASLSIAPADLSVALPNDAQLTVTATFTDGHTEDVTAQATWSSGDASIATVSNNTVPGPTSTCVANSGCVQSVQSGTATITATVGAVSVSTEVTVTLP